MVIEILEGNWLISEKMYENFQWEKWNDVNDNIKLNM